MNNKEHKLKMDLQKVALNTAKEALRMSGFDNEHKYYGLRLYEMQFAIYNQLKMVHEIID